MTLLFGLALAGVLIGIARVDFERRLIPDALNLLLAALGLAYQALAQGGIPVGSLVGAAVAFTALWVLRSGFRRLRGVTGLGLGDVKMAAAAATWIQPWNLPILLFAACLTALAGVGVLAMTGRRPGLRTAIPFGPFIGFGLMLTWLLELSDLPTLVPSGG